MRLIDADKLIELANNTKDKTIDANDIARFPTADVVEVVRCKDCKHRKKNTFCLHNMRYEDNNGFCSYGDRGKYEKNN